MFVILLGILLGLAIALGPLAWLQGAGEGVTGPMVTTVAEVLTRGIEAVPGADGFPNVVATFSVVVAVATPGLVALALAWCARTFGAASRSALAGVIAVLGVAAFFFVPFGQAVVAALVLGAAALLIVSPLGKLGLVASMALAVILAVDVIRSVVTGTNATVQYGTEVIGGITGLQAPEFWVIAVSVVAIAPFAAAANMLLRSLDRDAASEGEQY